LSYIIIRFSEAPDTGSLPDCVTQAGIPVEATNSKSLFFTYVLKSDRHDYYYKGHCQDLEKRISQHNSGMTKSIRSYIPFHLVYFEIFQTEAEAVKREKYFKSAAGRRFLKRNWPRSTRSVFATYQLSRCHSFGSSVNICDVNQHLKLV